MACCLWRFCLNTNQKLSANLIVSMRHGHHLRGRPPHLAKTLKQKLEELNHKDPDLHYRVDIGLPLPVFSRSRQLQERLKILKAQRKNPQLEKLARSNKLLIDLKHCYDEWQVSSGVYHIKQVADHYGVYQDLFGDAYFLPIVPIQISFNDVDSVKNPVYFGNVIKPKEAANIPEVNYDSNSDHLWTLILTNPDGHFNKQSREYVHWFVGNIPGNQVSKGETIMEYLQPFPPKGTGYHRHIFVLYKQNKRLDFSQFKKQGTPVNLANRTFSTLEFYRENQDELTPASLAFFQSDWDSSLPRFYHNILNMKEPRFEYNFSAPFIRKQEWFARGKPFNLYMDKYRDPKQINKEFLERKLKNVHPFRPPPAPLQFPNAVYFEKYTPSWLKLEIRKSRMKWGRINDIE